MRTILLACLVLLVAVTAAFPAATPESFVGDWEGTLEAVNLRVVLHLTHTEGKWICKMASPDQGDNEGSPCDEVTVKGTKLYLALDAFEVEFNGTLSESGNQIEGIFAQREYRWPLVLVRSGATPDAPVASAAVSSPFAGDWAGTLDAGMKLRLVVHLINTGGMWSGSMDSLDQGANGIPFTAVNVDGNKLHFEANSINGSYDGTLNGGTIKGTWNQSGNALPLDLVRGDASTMKGPNRPQEPKPPFPYRSEEVTVPGPGGITLAGTFTAPNGNGPFPAVVLLTGSGAQDRDEFSPVLNHKPFLVLSDYLTRQGIAVLRCDDRGFGKSTGNLMTATTEDFAQDALADVAFLKTRKEVDATKIGLIGHSEGGIIAPIAGSVSPDVAFMVLLAGPGVTGYQILLRQSELVIKANGGTDEMVKSNQETQRKMFDVILAEKDPKAAETKLLALGGLSAAEVKGVNSPWFRYFLAFDPATALRQVKVPVLALNGSLDVQVDPKQNLPVIEKALKDGGNKNVTIQEFAGLNHMFQTAKTGSDSEYASIEETMSPVAMKTISDWIVAHTTPKKK
jgi:pimeloyl-ACP methyl ester carboxylesterase